MPRRPDSATRARRLLVLLPLLTRGETHTVADLAAAVGGTAEEITGDLMTLTMCGVPPFSPFDLIDLEIDGDRVTVNMDLPAMDRALRLTGPEARALLGALDVAGHDSAAPVRRKLLAAAADDVSPEELERTLRAGAALEGVAALYSTLAAASEAHEKVRIVYLTGATGRISERVVHPWVLVDRLGTWYVVAFCEDAAEERVFRLDRIRSATPTGETFEPPSMPPHIGVTPSPGTLPVAEVVFAPGTTPPDAQAWPGAISELRADGSTLVKVPVQSVAWIARQVAAYLGAAEVTAPESVRTAVRELARHLARELA
jgi:proteasome accessory factor C